MSSIGKKIQLLEMHIVWHIFDDFIEYLICTQYNSTE